VRQQQAATARFCRNFAVGAATPRNLRR
jgi:hypothetical protein